MEQTVIELSVDGFSCLEVSTANTGARANGAMNVSNSTYFLQMTFAQRADGVLREQLLTRRIETFTGKPVRAK